MWKKLKAKRRRTKFNRFVKQHASEVIVGVLMGLLTDILTDLSQSKWKKAVRRL